jgi:hypothetical protein
VPSGTRCLKPTAQRKGHFLSKASWQILGKVLANSWLIQVRSSYSKKRYSKFDVRGAATGLQLTFPSRICCEKLFSDVRSHQFLGHRACTVHQSCSEAFLHCCWETSSAQPLSYLSFTSVQLMHFTSFHFISHDRTQICTDAPNACDAAHSTGIAA